MSISEEKHRSKSVLQLKSLSKINQGQFSEPAQLSSAILRHTNIQASFPKAERFPKLHMKEEGPGILYLQNTFSKRSTSFGFGRKQLTTFEQEMKDRLNPAPGSYELTNKPQKAYSFGNKLQNIILANATPGPGAYNLSHFQNSPKFSMYPKGSQAQIDRKSPDFTTYNPRDTITQNLRFRKITFGIGNRPDVAGNNKIPGPGSYQLYSPFDRFKAKK